MRVLFICGREPEYTRNRVIRKALAENGISLICCTSSSKFLIFRYFSVTLQFLLTGPWRYDAIFVGFFGHPIVFVVKPYAWLFKKPILFDAFVSAYDTMVWDRKYYPPGSRRARWMFLLDKGSCLISNHVLLDTDQNIDYWVKTFGLPRHLFTRVWFGADDELFSPMKNEKKENNGYFLVEFHGGFQPLQGIATILQAAKILMTQPDIHFRMIGDGPLYESMRQLSGKLELTNVQFLGKVTPAQIVAHLQECDVGLGVFGFTRKALCTIPNKAFEIVAAGKPLLTAETPATREFFDHGKTAYFCPPENPEALAGALAALKQNPILRKRLEEKGYEAFTSRAKPKVLGQQIKEILKSLLVS